MKLPTLICVAASARTGPSDGDDRRGPGERRALLGSVRPVASVSTPNRTAVPGSAPASGPDTATIRPMLPMMPSANRASAPTIAVTANARRSAAGSHDEFGQAEHDGGDDQARGDRQDHWPADYQDPAEHDAMNMPRTRVVTLSRMPILVLRLRACSMAARETVKTGRQPPCRPAFRPSASAGPGSRPPGWRAAGPDCRRRGARR